MPDPVLNDTLTVSAVDSEPQECDFTVSTEVPKVLGPDGSGVTTAVFPVIRYKATLETLPDDTPVAKRHKVTTRITQGGPTDSTPHSGHSHRRLLAPAPDRILDPQSLGWRRCAQNLRSPALSPPPLHDTESGVASLFRDPRSPQVETAFRLKCRDAKWDLCTLNDCTFSDALPIFTVDHMVRLVATGLHPSDTQSHQSSALPLISDAPPTTPPSPLN